MKWQGDMQADYLYTGAAGDRFFRHLKEKDTFLAVRCPECNKVFLPPRLFCEDCFCEISEWVEVPITGTVKLYTVVFLNAYEEKLKEPKIIGLINIDGTHGAMLGIIKADPEQDIRGLRVEAVLKKEREGNLKDILYFQPI